MKAFYLLALTTVTVGYVVNEGSVCTLYPESLVHNSQPINDVPSIYEAFTLYGVNVTVVFSNYAYMSLV